MCGCRPPRRKISPASPVQVMVQEEEYETAEEEEAHVEDVTLVLPMLDATPANSKPPTPEAEAEAEVVTEVTEVGQAISNGTTLDFMSETTIRVKKLHRTEPLCIETTI